MDVFKKFQAGEFSEAIDLWADELKEDALNQSIFKNLIKAKDHLDKIPEDDTSRTVGLNKISALQSFFNIKPVGLFREQSVKDTKESPVSGILETADGDIIISDDFNHRVQVYDKQHQLKFSFGQKGKKHGEFCYPKGIATDSEENIYVADCWNHRIQKFTKDGKFISTFGIYGSNPSQFNEPVSIAVNKNNHLLVVDRCNHRVQFFDDKGCYQGAIGHRGRIIEEDLAELFETPPDMFSLPSLEFPSDIAIDSKENIYVVDSHNHRILKFDSGGNSILSFGKQGKEQGEFLYPQSIAIDPFDNVFVSDLNNNRIQLFSPVGESYFSFSGSGSKENIESPTILACGKESSLYAGFAFDPKVLIFRYHSVSQKEKHGLREKVGKSSANSLFLSGNLLSGNQNWTEAIEKYEKAFSSISKDDQKIIPKLPLDYLHVIQKASKDELSPYLLNYYDKELSQLNKSIQELFTKRNDITKNLIDPILNAEKAVLEEKLTSGEIDKNLYELSEADRTCYRKSKEIFLEFIRIHRYQTEMFLLLMPKMLSEQNDNTIKQLIQKSLTGFYQSIDMLNVFLDSHDLHCSACFKEIQNGNKGAFNLRDFRIAFALKGASNDFVQLSLPILKNTIHQLIQIAIKVNASKSNNIDLFGSIIQESNLVKLGQVLFKLRYDFNAMLQFKESLKNLISYSKLNLDKIFTDVLSDRSFDKKLFLNKDSLSYEKDLIELLFVEEIGIHEAKKELGIGLFSFTESDLESFQLQEIPNGDESYTAYLNQLQNSIDRLLLEKKELDSLILKYELNLKTIHSGDQRSRLQIMNENNLANAQSSFGCRLISEHIFLYRIINFKRCMYLLLESECEGRQKDQKAIDEICHKIDTYCNDVNELLKGYRDNIKKTRSELLSLWEIDLSNRLDSSYVMDRDKEINTSTRLFQLDKDLQKFEILNNEYASVYFIQDEVKKYLTQKSPSKSGVTTASQSLKLYGDLQFGILGTDKGQFNSPTFICSNLNGDIFVSDTLNHRIQKFTPDGNYLSSFGSFGDFKGFFNQPHGILCDPDNNIFVCDLFNHRIQKFDSLGEHITSWGGLGDKEGYFNRPIGICQDSEGFLYISDMGNHRVQKFTADGQFVLSFGKQGKNDGDFFKPVPVCHHNNMILIGEISTDRIQMFDKKGSFIKSFNYSQDTPSDFRGTSNISVDSNGNLYISEFWNNKISILSDEFLLTTSLHLSGGSKVSLYGPCGITFSKDYMLLCNRYNHKIHRFTEKLE